MPADHYAAMTFDQWLDAPISGTTRRAYYSPDEYGAARDAWEASTATEREACESLAWEKSQTTPRDNDFTRGYACGRQGAAMAIRSRGAK